MIYTIMLTVESDLSENDVAAAFNYCEPRTDHIEKSSVFNIDVLNTSIRIGE